MKILILGHNGMLGNTAYKYFSNKYDVEIIEKYKWCSSEFINSIVNSSAEYIINCIGAIPQKNYFENEYRNINVNLPMFLETLNKKIIHPSTDCEFSGNLPFPKKYEKDDDRNAIDLYGKSKGLISSIIDNYFVNTKIIRTSIIGHELNHKCSLLEWFLNSNKDVNGYTNHYWNGITTLYWCEFVDKIINDWDKYEKLIQIGTDGLNKYSLLQTIQEVYNKDNVEIFPFEADMCINKMLQTDFKIPTIKEQLIELKKFYNK